MLVWKAINLDSIGEVGAALDVGVGAITCLEQTVEFFSSSQPTSRQVSGVQAQLVHWDNRLGYMQRCDFNSEQENQLRQLHFQVR